MLDGYIYVIIPDILQLETTEFACSIADLNML